MQYDLHLRDIEKEARAEGRIEGEKSEWQMLF